MERLDSSRVLTYARKKKRFSTMDVANKFKVKKLQASAAIAILRIKEVIVRDDPSKDADGVSLWVWTGS